MYSNFIRLILEVINLIYNFFKIIILFEDKSYKFIAESTFKSLKKLLGTLLLQRSSGDK